MEYKTFLNKIRKRNGEKFLPKTIDLYDSFIQRYETQLIERKNNIDELIEYMNSLIVNYHNPTLKASFRLYLLYIGLSEDDERIKKLKKPKRRASAMTSLSMLGEKVIPEKDLEFLYDNVDDEWKLIIGFLYDTAVRESEMLSLRWRNITFYDEPMNNILAEAQVIGKGNKPRIVYITGRTVKLLKKLRPNIEENDLVFVFKKYDGTLYKRQEKALYDGIVKKTKKILGKKYTVHSFRHSRATHIVNKGGEVGGVSNMLGHANFSTTQIYIKSSNMMAKNMLKNLEDS